MANFRDMQAAQDVASARERIEAIYTNAGASAPSNLDALAARAVELGGNYFDTVRNHATTAAEPVKSATRPQPGDPGTTGATGGGSAAAPAAPTAAELAQQARMANKDAMRAVVGWLPKPLIDVYINEWVKHGDGQLAWAVVRTQTIYDQYFPGIKRDDGQLRMTEQEFVAHREAFDRELMQYGFNPQMFAGHHEKLMRGDVSAAEFRQRIEAKVTGVVQNLDEVRERFGNFYGIANMTDEALVAAALDPQIGLDLLQGRITAAQVAGEAAVAGFIRDRGRAEHLAFAGGLDQAGARQLFSQAATAVPKFGRFAERFNDRDPFGVTEFEDASVFADSEERQRMTRLQASEESLFKQGGQIARDRTGLSGLRQR